MDLVNALKIIFFFIKKRKKNELDLYVLVIYLYAVSIKKLINAYSTPVLEVRLFI